jgi:hypothetical protein
LSRDGGGKTPLETILENRYKAVLWYSAGWYACTVFLSEQSEKGFSAGMDARQKPMSKLFNSVKFPAISQIVVSSEGVRW